MDGIMSNYCEKAAKVTGAAGALLAASDDFLRGNLLSGLVDGFSFGVLGYLLGYVAGGVADFFSHDDEKSAKKSANNDAIHNKLTA
ncbi:MAG: hypothetical protein KKE71_02005 [Nanoarchaeota archaeon]|nr:hypothetical protein [Nanoarchaeota archaeon]